MVGRLFRESVVFPRMMEGDERVTAGGVPSLYETEEGYELYVAVPGAQADNLDISLQATSSRSAVRARGRYRRRRLPSGRASSRASFALPGGCPARWRGAR